ncbi:hypothetical protein JWG45_17220 [Leptospira sp. 201903070]|uniref:DUF4421 domain-containing protein n=1 Tax=Leptospira ainlahdjerensis TaxID=2810033 RepID=A0ABS2UFF0_9LEPT|nr:hypothetical protein [Leptospira ainlahdjerensis]MBM9578889.1 hypothetical protein [Leptospira ainlahdjerensis]
MKNKFKCFIAGCFLFSSILIAEEEQIKTENQKPKFEPKYELILRRQSFAIDPLESNWFEEKYAFYIGSRNKRTTSIYFGLKFFLPKINSYIETNFFELKKSNLSKSTLYCSNDDCYVKDYSIGSYYRFDSELNLIWNVYSDKVGIGGGLRYINSNLSLNQRDSFFLYLGSHSYGPQVSLRFRTPAFYDFYLSGKFNYFYLFGDLVLRNGYRDPRSFLGYNDIDNETKSTYIGKELEVVLNYSISDQIVISWGAGILGAVAKPKLKDIRSFDPSNDLSNNLRLRVYGGQEYVDYIYNAFLQVSFKI